MRCDLHGFELMGAKDEILLKLEECQIKGDKVLEIVHGYHGGQVLRNYCRSRQLIEDTILAGLNNLLPLKLEDDNLLPLKLEDYNFKAFIPDGKFLIILFNLS